MAAGPSAAASTASLDIDAWLRRPGVKLVAVEFYATWCEPCVRAVPRWKALQEKYQSKGLRFIVVATQDPEAVLKDMGWTPDALVLDDPGVLAQRFGATKLPSAYLWSWQGHLLASGTHVDDIESKIETWMRTSPRVEVEVDRVARSADVAPADLMTMVRGELRAADKLVVVATPQERKALRAILRRSLVNSADEKLQCKLGEAVTANSLVKASVGGNRQIQLQVFSAEKQCLVASASTRWRSDNAAASVREAVTALVGRLRLTRTEYPWGASAPPAVAGVGFGANLGALPEVPQLGDAQPTFSGGSLQTVDLTRRQLIGRARRSEDNSKRSYILRAAAWHRLARHVGADTPTGRQAIQRAEEWEAINEQVCKRQAQLEEIRKQKAAEQQKLDGLLALDAYSATPEEKQAWQAEFTAAYQVYETALAAGPDPLARCGSGDMVDVPGGPFFMGCNEAVDRECGSAEKPGRTVSVEAFRIDKTEVTVAAYKSCVDAGDCKRDTFLTKSDDKYCNWGYSDRGQHSMNCVSWFGADAYCRSRGQRLPSEAEWEKAARGTDGARYPWGNEGFGTTKVANIADQNTTFDWALKSYDDGYAETAPVGSYPLGASPYGALDMVGNVGEWTADWYERGKSRSLRGGSWYAEPRYARASSRYGVDPAYRVPLVGFRCVQ